MEFTDKVSNALPQILFLSFNQRRAELFLQLLGNMLERKALEVSITQ
jgi:hypothetical protein